MKLVWFAGAVRDLERIASHIHNDNPDAAARVELCLRAAVEHLERFPRAGRRTRQPDVREVVVLQYPYTIRYRIADEQIQILRIFHQAMLAAAL